MKKLKKCLLLSLLALSSFYAVAQRENRPVQTGASFLSIAPEPRGAAMGDVGVATSTDIYAQYWNAAKYAFADSKGGVGFAYTPWLTNVIKSMGLSDLTGYYRIDDLSAVSASFRFFSRGEVELTDEQGEATSLAKPRELAFDLAYSRKLSRSFSMSVAFRYVRSDLDIQNLSSAASAFSVDIAAYQQFGFNFSNGQKGLLSWGVNLSNMGTKLIYKKDDIVAFLPTNMRLGTAFAYDVTMDHKLTVTMDLCKLMVPTSPNVDPSDLESLKNFEDYENSSAFTGIFKSFSDAGFKNEMREITIGGGVEYGFRDLLFVRAGYFYENEYKGDRNFTSFGAGLKLGAVSIDGSYLITNKVSAIDQTFRVALSVNL